MTAPTPAATLGGARSRRPEARPARCPRCPADRARGAGRWLARIDPDHRPGRAASSRATSSTRSSSTKGDRVVRDHPARRPRARRGRLHRDRRDAQDGGLDPGRSSRARTRSPTRPAAPPRSRSPSARRPPLVRATPTPRAAARGVRTPPRATCATIPPVNPLDLVAIVLVVLAVLLGFRSGALPQVGGLLGAIGGGALAVLALPLLDRAARRACRPGSARSSSSAGCSRPSGSANRSARRSARGRARALGNGVLGAADRVAGGLTGAAQALLIVWLAGGLLAIGPVPRLTEAAQTSTAIRTLNAALPPPVEIAAELGTLLDASGLPEVFVGFEPLPRPPVEPPTDATAQGDRRARRGQHASGSSAATCGVRIVGQRRGRRRRVRRDERPRRRRRARERGVRVDRRRPGRSTRGSSCSTRSSTSRSCTRPTCAACRSASPPPIRTAARSAPPLGYPGGGGLTVVPAAVTGAYPATGRDIYDEAPVRREILELRAADRSRRQRRPVRAARRDDRRPGLRRGADRSGRRLRAQPDGGRDPRSPPAIGPDRCRRHRGVPALAAAVARHPAARRRRALHFPSRRHRTRTPARCPTPPRLPRHPVRPPDRPRQAPFRRPDRRPGPRRRAGDAQGHRLHRRGPRQAARRRGHDLDRDDAVQLQPAAPGRARQGRHPGGRRHADGVQHDLGQRRRVDGHRGHEGIAHQPRGRRRLDRARRARPPPRRRRLPGRLRQDHPRRGDGPRPRSTSRA